MRAFEHGLLMDRDDVEELIVVLLRAKRKTKDHDLELTKKLNEWQRKLEGRYDVTGVELAPEYDE